MNEQAAGQALAAASHSNARDYRLAGDGGAPFAGGCTSTFPASPADADNDNIPDELTVITYTNCTEGPFTFSGTQTLDDDDTGSAGFEFQSIWDTDAAGTINDHAVEISYSGIVTANGGTAGAFALSDTAQIVTSVSGDDANATVEDNHVWDLSFTPDDGVWTPVPGLPLEDGDLSLSGTWNVVIDDGDEFDFTATISTTATLRTSAACATSIVSGSVEAFVLEPDVGAELTVTWTGCAQLDIAYVDAGF